MIFKYFSDICKGALWISLVIIACTAYAYLVNARRAKDDPKKKDYNPFSILIALISLPLLLTLAIFVFMIRALLFAGLLFLGTIGMIALRKPFVFILLDKIAMKIGEPLLKLNT
jgi:ABC-type multidrug transport system permease subunit